MNLDGSAIEMLGPGPRTVREDYSAACRICCTELGP
jgi:hypothetical protein